MTDDRKEINRAAENWWQQDAQNRACFCLISELCPDDEPHGSATIGGNRDLIIESIANALMQAPDFLPQVFSEAINLYNNYVANHRMNLN